MNSTASEPSPRRMSARVGAGATPSCSPGPAAKAAQISASEPPEAAPSSAAASSSGSGPWKTSKLGDLEGLARSQDSGPSGDQRPGPPSR